MPASRNATFSLPEEVVYFLETLAAGKKSAFVADAIERRPEFQAWKEGQA